MTRIVRAAALVVSSAVLAAASALPGNVTGDREVTAEFTDVGDLVVGHSVQVADVRIGSVTKIELTDDYQALVTMSLKNDVFVPRESRALLRTTSLLGEKFIELRPLDTTDPMAGTDLVDGDAIVESGQAPELEFVAEQAVEILGSVVASDVATIVDTGAVGFGGRGEELTSLVLDLSTVASTLADQTDEIVRIIDALDGATATLAEGSPDISALLVNLADASTALSVNRQKAVDAVEELTRLAEVQNDILFDDYLDDIDRQIGQVDAVLAEVASNQQQIEDLLFWLGEYFPALPLVVPDNFAQVYAWFDVQVP